MVTAMMLPSAVPMIALYGTTRRQAPAPGTAVLPVALFTSIYLGLCAVTGIPMYLVSVALSGSPAMRGPTRRPGCSSSPGASSSRRSSRCACGVAATHSGSSSATGAGAGAAA